MDFVVFRKEIYRFPVTMESNELTVSKESNESSLAEIYMSVVTEVEIPDGIRLISLIAMYIYPECEP